MSAFQLDEPRGVFLVLVPVIVLLAASVAVKVRLPIALNVAMNVPDPVVKVLPEGSESELSVLLNRTVPLYVVAVLLNCSC